MRSIQATAIILWFVIFVIAAFILGQFLLSKDIFDITTFFISAPDKEETVKAEVNDELQNDEIINKIGQETVRIGQNVALDYFSDYYKYFVDYVMQNENTYEDNVKIGITDTQANDYVFYALSRNIDNDKYAGSASENTVNVSEASVNSFIDNMFDKEITDSYRNNKNNGYDSDNKTYNVLKNSSITTYTQELINIENVTSNQVILKFNCKTKTVEDVKNTVSEKKQINITAVYRGGRYIVTEVEKTKSK